MSQAGNLTGGGFIQSPYASRFLTSTLTVARHSLTRAREKAVSQAETVFHNLAVSALELKFSRIVLSKSQGENT